MKTGEQFLKDIYEKADVIRAKEAEAAVLRKKRMKLVTGLTAAAACVMIAVGVGALPVFMTSDGAAELAARYEENGSIASGTNSGGSSDSLDSLDGFDNIAAYSSDDTAARSRKNDEPSYQTGQKNGAGEENAGSAADDAKKSGKSGKLSDSSDSSDSSEQLQTQSYFCLPARVVIEDRKGNAEACTGEAAMEIFQELRELSAEGKAVSARLGEPAPVKDYVKRIIYVTHAEENKNADGTLRLDDYNSENTVWYVIEE